MARLFAGAAITVNPRLRIRRVLAYVRRMKDPKSSERIQRIRIGLTGLAFVFLLVLLGTAISRSGNDPTAGPPVANGLADSSEPEEPLAQIGVAPGQSTANGAGEPAPTP